MSSSTSKKFIPAVLLATVFGLSACSGGGGGSSTPANPTVETKTITGGATKGPLTNANVAIYEMNFSAGSPPVPSDAIDTGTTNNQARIQDLQLSFPLNPPYLLEFTATTATKDLSTCADPADLTSCFAPVLTTMRTVVTEEMLTSGQNVYATPLTTMAVQMAMQQNAADTAGFLTNLDMAARRVASTLGFGMSSSIDIFNTPPLVDETTDTDEKLGNTASYRSAIEAMGAVVHQIQQNSSAANGSAVLDELADDLASDGTIDGNTSSGTSTVVTSSTLQALAYEPKDLTIPNTTKKVSGVTTELQNETSSTGTNTDTTALGSVEVIIEPAQLNEDIDGDGVFNVNDAFPRNPLADTDTDGDRLPDVVYQDAGTADSNGDGFVDRLFPAVVDITAPSDTDDDNDGWADDEDDYPLDASRFLDPAGHRDVDSIPNGVDNCPLIANEDQTDTDGDGVGDACSDDNDGDGVIDSVDNCEFIANTGQGDYDVDGVGDACDNNIDGDSALNEDDAFPFDPTETIDTDRDGIGNNEDADDDNDGLSDVDEDSAGTDPLDRDTDGDGVLDGKDIDPLDPLVTINYAPVAQNSAVSTDEDTPVSVTVIGALVSDTNAGDTLTISSVGAADNGSVVINGGSVEYTPSADFNGSDSFDYTVSDGTVTATATITVTVNAINDAPVIAAAGPFSLAENTANSTVVGSVSATDVDSDVTGYSIAGGNTGNAFAIDNNGQITVADTTVIDYESATSFNLSIIATDGVASSAAEVVVVNLTDVNDVVPVVAAAGPFSVAEDVANSTVVGSVIATDADSAVIGYSITAGNTGNAFAIDASGQITVVNTAAIDFESATSFSLTITATDGVNTSAGEVISVNVTDVNDSTPVVTPAQSFDVSDAATNGAVVGTVVATDADSSGVSGFTILSGNTGTVFAIDSNGQITVINDANLNDFATYTLSVEATDGVNTSAPENVTINVVANPTPVIDQAGPLSVTMDEDGAPTAFVAPTITATDADPMTWSTTGASNGTATVSGTGTSPTTLTYVPNANFVGSDSFDVVVSDGITTASITVNVTVNAVNDNPLAVDDSLVTDEDTAATTLDVTANDSDIESVSLTAALLDNAFNGNVVDNGDNTFTYTPNPDFNGFDSFTYTLSDGDGGSATATVNITVNAVNDAPVAEADSASTSVDTAVTVNVLSNDSDVDGDTLTASLDTNASNGNVVDNGDGTFEYTPTTSFEGVDSFTYTLSDGSLTATGTVTISVNAGVPFTPGATVDAAALLSGTGIYEFWDDDWDGPGYWHLSVNGTTIVDEEAQWSSGTGSFVTLTGETDIMMTTSGWVEHDIVADAVSTLNNVATVQIKDPSANVVGSWELSFESMDISGTEMGLYVPQSILGNAAATFSPGAQWIRSTTSNTMDYMYLQHWGEDDCDPTNYANWNNNCNVVWQRSMNSLILGTMNPATDLSFVGDATQTIQLGYHNYSGSNGTSLLGVFSGGNVSYYTVNWDMGTTAVDTGVTGTYTLTSNYNGTGVDLIEYIVPTSVPDYAQFNLHYDAEFGGSGVLSVHNGYLRYGEIEPDTITETLYMLNDVAAADVLANPAAPSLACNYETPWDDIDDQPAAFDSYDGYESVLSDCANVQTLSSEDVEGTWSESFSEDGGWVETTFTYNNGGTGTYVETLDGVEQVNISFNWTLSNNRVTWTVPGMYLEVWALLDDGSLKVYSEDANWTPGSDLSIVDTSTADGEIWTGYFVKQESLACGYESGWDDTADGGLGAPINPNSFAEYEALLADCGTAQLFTVADLAGAVLDDDGSITTFNDSGNAGTEADPKTGVISDGGDTIDFVWYVEDAGTHSYLVMYSDDTIEPTALPSGFSFRETKAIMEIGVNTITFTTYSEQSNFSDMDRATDSDGEIWTSTVIEQ